MSHHNLKTTAGSLGANTSGSLRIVANYVQKIAYIDPAERGLQQSKSPLLCKMHNRGYLYRCIAGKERAVLVFGFDSAGIQDPTSAGSIPEVCVKSQVSVPCVGIISSARLIEAVFNQRH